MSAHIDKRNECRGINQTVDNIELRIIWHKVVHIGKQIQSGTPQQVVLVRNNCISNHVHLQSVNLDGQFHLEFYAVI